MSVLHRMSLVAVIAALPILLHVRGCSGDGSGPSLDVTRLFTMETNSTCGGDPPTLFESRSGDLMNCSLSEHNPSFAVDGDPTTWWQSQNDNDPVALTFSLTEVCYKWACLDALASICLASDNFYELLVSLIYRLEHPSVLC